MIQAAGPRTYINQRNFRLAIAGIFFAAVIGFFAYQFKFLRAPAVVIFAPGEDIVTESSIFDIRGKTDPDVDLTLNGRPLYSGETGEFSERVYLFSGVNKLEFEAKNRYRKTTTLIRYIVVKPESNS